MCPALRRPMRLRTSSQCNKCVNKNISSSAERLSSFSATHHWSLWSRIARGRIGSGSRRRTMVPKTEWKRDNISGDEFDGIAMLRICVQTLSSVFRGVDPALSIVIACIRSIICALGLHRLSSNKNLIAVEAIMKVCLKIWQECSILTRRVSKVVDLTRRGRLWPLAMITRDGDIY